MMKLSLAELQTALGHARADVWPSLQNRAAWDKVAATPYGARVQEATVNAAQAWLEQPIVLPSLTDYLQYDRTGSRAESEQRVSALAHRLSAFTLAACFTAEDRYIDGALDGLWATTELWTWVMAAHQGTETADSPGFDLGTGMRAMETGAAWQLLGAAWREFHPRIARRYAATLDERVFQPYLSRDDYWWLAPTDKRQALNNWTAVCSGSALVCALATLDDEPEKQARVVQRATESLGHFLSVFGENGSLDEGAGYWVYGFSHYVMAAERLLARTDGAVDLLADPMWREVARFPLRVNLHGDNYVNFSDCASRVLPPFGWIAWLGNHLDLPDVCAWAARLQQQTVAHNAVPMQTHNNLNHTLRNLVWSADTSQHQAIERPMSVFLPDVSWLVARSSRDDDALVLAIKGGHNGEQHNHNDCGSFIVHWQSEALVDEIGAPTYTRQFFSGARYENLAARSLGHSVPLVNGQEQIAGRDFQARVVERGDSFVSLDLAACYPAAANLVSLRRTARLENETIFIEDETEFSGDGAIFSTQLITRDCTVKTIAGEAIIGGARGALRVSWPHHQATARSEHLETEDPRFLDKNGVSRLARLWFDVTVENRRAALSLQLSPLKGTADFDRT